jgi:hypothetical protein
MGDQRQRSTVIRFVSTARHWEAQGVLTLEPDGDPLLIPLLGEADLLAAVEAFLAKQPATERERCGDCRGTGETWLEGELTPRPC